MSRAPINILDRPLGGRGSRVETQVSLSAFSYLYSELVQYHQNRVDSISELERRLESSGYGVGLKILELITYRNREVGTVVSHRYRISPWFFSIDDIMCLFSYC